MSEYVIVGGSVGAIGAVEAIREIDPLGTITVISAEPFPQYSRPMVASYVSGEATLEKMKYRDDQFWEKNKVQALVGRKAMTIDLAGRYVVLDRGDKISFGKLLIATGGKPLVPKTEGVGKDGVFTFTDLTNAENLRAKLKEGRTAVVIGGGLIGVSVAEALVKSGAKVTIVELRDRILNLILDEVASKIVEKVISESGVAVVTGQTVQRILGKSGDSRVVSGIVLANGEEMPCDLVVIAIGVVPRTELAVGTDLRVNNGVIVDRFMRTNIPDVYACGDVAEAYDFIFETNRLLPLWPVAHLGGRVAGLNMAGKKTEYPGGTLMSALKYFGLPVISVGMTVLEKSNGYEVLVDHRPAGNVYKKIVLKNDVMVGMTLVGNIERAGIIFHLMKNRVNVRQFKRELVSEDFGLINIPAPLRKKLFMMGD